MLSLSMDTQAHVNMAHAEIQKERSNKPEDEITEEQFLKDLYLFMKKRDTPIERIPHLGFKQIDLFVMFKTVRDLGGYHQVTGQQLWKQVYNTLGGNPRSTSAATCTRRHYEKLLLPYECHVKGILMSSLPLHPPKSFHYFSKDDDDNDGQRAAKRKLIPIALSQPMTEHLSYPYSHQSSPHHNVFPLPFNYSNYPHPGYPVLPYHVNVSVLTPCRPPSPKSQFTVQPSYSPPEGRLKGPLEQLRNLANRYKYDTGLDEPLNLSVKSPSQETNRNPASSFSAPSSTKKFLNKPSPLYTGQQRQIVTNEETQNSEAADGGAQVLHPVEEKDAYIVDVKSAPSSPAIDCAPTPTTNTSTTAMPQISSSPKTDFATWFRDERERKAEQPSFSHVLPRSNGGKMEIEIPLSVFQEWFRFSSAKMQGAKQVPALPTQGEHPAGKKVSDADVNDQRQSPAAEDLRLKPMNAPSPETGRQHNTSQHHFTNYRPLPLGGILKNAPSWDVYAGNQKNSMKSHVLKNGCDAYDKDTKDLKVESMLLRAQQDVALAKRYSEEAAKGGKEIRSSVLMVDSSPSSVLHLTTEEVMKLKKIISSSL